jgi:polyhydroxybutyrate depolymerase
MKHSCSSVACWLIGAGLSGVAGLGCDSSGERATDPAAWSVYTGASPGTAGATGPSSGRGPASGAAGASGAEQPNGEIPLTGPGGTGNNSPGASSGAPAGSATDSPLGTDASVPTRDPAPACPSTLTAASGETTQTLSVGGQNRSYLLHVPPGYTGATPVPVVFDFHGLGGNGNQQRNLSGWAAVADREGQSSGGCRVPDVPRLCRRSADHALHAARGVALRQLPGARHRERGVGSVRERGDPLIR